MANAKGIRTKIRSVKSTQKITRAMEMVAASKMRRAQDRMLMSRPYAEKMRAVIGHIAQSHSEYRHPYLMRRPNPKRMGLIVVTSDRGLCGGLNINLLKTTVLTMRAYHQQQQETDLCLMGIKAEHFFKRHGGRVLAQVNHLGDIPKLTDLIGVVRAMLTAYDSGAIDQISVVFNRFVNTMTQKPVVQPLLPLPLVEVSEKMHVWDYIYEPDAKILMDSLLKRYIESQVYQAVIENLACEQAARMVAMKNASENAGNLMDDLQLAYNKARQAAITQELAEIVAGAALV